MSNIKQLLIDLGDSHKEFAKDLLVFTNKDSDPRAAKIASEAIEKSLAAADEISALVKSI
jgi:hypothetical protein